MTREYERGGLEDAAVVGEPERGCPRAGKGDAGAALVLRGAIAASPEAARAEPVGLMGLTHWGAKCMDIWLCEQGEDKIVSMTGAELGESRENRV